MLNNGIIKLKSKYFLYFNNTLLIKNISIFYINKFVICNFCLLYFIIEISIAKFFYIDFKFLPRGILISFNYFRFKDFDVIITLKFIKS